MSAVLSNEQLTVTFLPEKGGDIYALVDRETGVDVLFKTPWGRRSGGEGYLDGSQAHWLSRYAGGWQVLCPNAGTESTEHGTTWGFHGEAALVPWQLRMADDATARLETALFLCPLRLQRRLTLAGPVLRVEETVINESPDPVDIMWVHHPAFGDPLVAPGSRLWLGARTVTADDTAPGTLLAPGSTHSWPYVTSAAGDRVDLSVLPRREERRETFAYLSDFIEPFAAVTNPELPLGLAMRWSADAFPHAWFWQELGASAGFPWYRRAYVTAVEPASAFPGDGLNGLRRRGLRPLTLPPGGRRQAMIEVAVHHDPREVVGVEPGGRPRFVGD